MITFTDLVNICKESSGVSDSASVIKFKRDINTGAALFMSKLGRQYNQGVRYTNMIANQQFYQLPEDALRVMRVKVKVGQIWYFVDRVSDGDKWTLMNQTNQVSNRPTHYYIKGFDEFGLYPTPSTNTTDTIELTYTPKNKMLTQDDYTAGTISATNGTQTITGSGTVFTSNMVGRYLQVTDGTDGNWYRISAFVSSTQLTIENFYQGISGSGLQYRIGEVVNIPEEFQESPADYALFRHFTRRGQLQQKNDFKAMFDNAVELAEDLYASTSNNQVINVNNLNKVYNPLTDTPLNF